ncbi:MAG: F0F1 ATP synthase subunit epsilon [Oscillospiraceae bacterium]|nr:F0F1 ATP synthase subunit epsilon [Oscillospiraceae bacterium]
MEKLFRLSVVTAEATAFEGEVSYVNLPTPFGSLGVLAQHAPLLCAVERGIVRCTLESGETLRIRVGDGVASVADNEATLLVASAERFTE